MLLHGRISVVPLEAGRLYYARLNFQHNIFTCNADKSALLRLRRVRVTKQPLVLHPEQSVFAGKRAVNTVKSRICAVGQHDKAVKAAVTYAAGSKMQHTRVNFHGCIWRQIKSDDTAAVKRAIYNIFRQGEQQNKPCC